MTLPRRAQILLGQKHHKVTRAFGKHVLSSKKRGIPFEMTFEEWCKIWETSGKFMLRGKDPNQYCMARLGDKGAYVADNVKIVPNIENWIEGGKNGKGRPSRRKGRTFSATHKLTVLQAEEIRQLNKQGCTQGALAKKFRVALGTIYRALYDSKYGRKLL